MSNSQAQPVFIDQQNAMHSEAVVQNVASSTAQATGAPIHPIQVTPPINHPVHQQVADNLEFQQESSNPSDDAPESGIITNIKHELAHAGVADGIYKTRFTQASKMLKTLLGKVRKKAEQSNNGEPVEVRLK